MDMASWTTWEKVVSTPNTFSSISGAGMVTHIKTEFFAEAPASGQKSIHCMYVSQRLIREANTTDSDTLDTLDTFHVRRLQTASELQLERFAFFCGSRSIWTPAPLAHIWSQQVSSPFWCAFIIIYCDILVRTCSLLRPGYLGIMCTIWYSA